MRITYQRALEAQLVLMELNNLNLPVKSAVGLARFSNFIDSELKIYDHERRKLIANYNIVVRHGDTETLFNLSCPTVDEEDKEPNLREFTARFQELLGTELPDWDAEKIMLPEDLTFSPKRLKAVADFIEVM